MNTKHKNEPKQRRKEEGTKPTAICTTINLISKSWKFKIWYTVLNKRCIFFKMGPLSDYRMGNSSTTVTLVSSVKQ